MAIGRTGSTGRSWLGIGILAWAIASPCHPARAGSISGTVTRSGIPQVAYEVIALNTAGKVAGRANTGKGGGYKIDGLADGTYYVRTQGNRGLVDEFYDDVPMFSFEYDQRIPAVAAGVVITKLQSPDDIDFALGTGGQILGTVESERGVPLAGCDVVLYVGDDLPVAGAQANTVGDYRISGLPAATYYARTDAEWQGYEDEYYEDAPVVDESVHPCATSIAVAAGGIVEDIDFQRAPIPPRIVAFESVDADSVRLWFTTFIGGTYTVESCELTPPFSPDDWVAVSGFMEGTGTTEAVVDSLWGAPAMMTYRVRVGPPEGMMLVPGGTFTMGCQTTEGYSDEVPVHDVPVTAFYLDRDEVTLALWEDVRAWALAHDYEFDSVGGGKGPDHPVHSVTWYDAVKWCNARSEKEDLDPVYHLDSSFANVYRTGEWDVMYHSVRWTANGYRLPTEVEWEKAARGGAIGRRFPWVAADTVDHARATYHCVWSGGGPLFSYDVNPGPGSHPLYTDGTLPSTAPVGSFPANGYGFRDVAGNILEWCWDWYQADWYDDSRAVLADTRGPNGGDNRVLRGGSSDYFADNLRCANRRSSAPEETYTDYGFRCARGR